MDLRKLKEVRKMRRIKIKDIAKETGISRNLVSLIENGKGNPSFRNVEKIANTIGLEIMIYLK